MGNVNIIIDGLNIVADENMTLLEVALANGINIPTLCYLKDINKGGLCRICVCEVVDSGKLITACNTKVREGLNVLTGSPAVVESRRMNLELIAEGHDGDCTECARGGDCEFQALCKDYGVDIKRFAPITETYEKDKTGTVIIRDNSKCILCRRCVSICKKMLGESAIGVFGRGGNTKIGINVQIKDTDCINCGLCAAYCPVGALKIKDGSFSVWKAIADPSVKVAAILTPETADQVGECFGTCAGENSAAKLVTMLKNIGFNEVYAMKDVEIAAGGKGIVSICPGMKDYISKLSPEVAEMVIDGTGNHILACKSCKEVNENVFTVLMSTCALEKAAFKGEKAVDAVLTVPEVAGMIKKACVSSATAMSVWAGLEAGRPDAVLEDVHCGRTVSGPEEIKTFLNDIREGRGKDENVRLLLCPGGCSNGGGQNHQRRQ